MTNIINRPKAKTAIAACPCCRELPRRNATCGCGAACHPVQQRRRESDRWTPDRHYAAQYVHACGYYD